MNMQHEHHEQASRQGNHGGMRAIGLEEHFASPAFLEVPERKEGLARLANRPGYEHILENLADIGESRIAEMDAAGIGMQVLTLTDPGVQQLEADEALALARESNDYLASAVQQYPDRLAGFAALPVGAPDTAADELERMVSEHGFKGGLVNGHVGGRYLDDQFFWPIFERAQLLKVPLYIHPTPPPKPVVDAYYSGFSPEVSMQFARAGWGWHIETAIHVLRLILGGVFDRFPDLQVIIGHLGETLPFMLPRLDRNLPAGMTGLDRSVASYLRENIYYTFSGFNFTPTFLDLYLQVGADRIMFSTDYPFASMAEARAFLDHLPVSAADKDRIAHGNAENLLRL
ncbi:MAG TPA: amidohydrolase family protein [Candidatus Lokiarchaeia archaeon]|nr:amidohydrolase family protein [Candidatus Lokiarchaeia archaeon]